MTLLWSVLNMTVSVLLDVTGLLLISHHGSFPVVRTIANLIISHDTRGKFVCARFACFTCRTNNKVRSCRWRWRNKVMVCCVSASESAPWYADAQSCLWLPMPEQMGNGISVGFQKGKSHLDIVTEELNLSPPPFLYQSKLGSNQKVAFPMNELCTQR